MMRLMDFHMHTAASEDSEAPIEAMCDAAVARGLCAVAITDHVEMVEYEGMYAESLRQSWKESGRAVSLYRGRLRIARGIELGEPLADREETDRILREHDFDFVLASQHKLNHRDDPDNVDYYFLDYTRRDVGETMDAYFDAVLELVRWGRFHSLAHLTYPFRYIPEPLRPADYSRWQDRIDAVLRTLAQQGLALEINTSGLRQKGCGTTHPDLPIVRRFRELGGERITIGADAHRPQDVGAHLEVAASMAREAGFRYLTMYFGGQAEMVPLEG